MSSRKYISDFINRGGISVFISTGFVKFSAAILSIVVVRLLSKDEYGILAYALSLYGIGIVISGFGGQFSLLRYGSLLPSQSKKRSYYCSTMVGGIKRTCILALIVSLSSFLPIHPKGSAWYVFLTGIALISFYIIELQRSYFRVLNLNRLYSRVNETYSILIVISVIISTYLLGGCGYMLAYILMPIIIFFMYNRNHFNFKPTEELPPKYWSYGLHTALGSVANQVIFSIAPFLLGLLGASESSIADFKVATIIPFNLLTLPGILMITDFNFLSKSYLDAHKIREYYINYLKVIVPITTLLFIPLTVFGKYIILFLFGSEYEGCFNYYILFMISTYITFFFRNPLGNILLAVGKASWNGYNAYAFGLIYILFTILGYKFWGIYSAVYGLCSVFILSGFVSLILYKKYLKMINK